MRLLCLWAASLGHCSAHLLGPTDRQYQQSQGPSSRVFEHNENHVFNAVHSAMKQWGSSVHHNGMSFFLASVPAGTQLYHGRADNNTVRGMEWLAFEPEHAYNFARVFRDPPRRPPHERPQCPDCHGKPERTSPEESLDSPTNDMQSPEDTSKHFLGQHVLRAPTGDDSGNPVPESGWFHTYKTTNQLRLLYIDGMSAGKTAMGTLDTQDVLLLNRNASDQGSQPQSHPGFQSDFERATQLCDLVDNRWAGQVDGFVRAELGFEIILCSFEKHLKLVSKVRGNDNDEFWFNADGWIHAAASRYDGIGGDRVTVNFDRMITLFDQPVDLFYDGRFPRLGKLSQDQRTMTMDDLDKLVLSEETASNTTNWQAAAEMIVARYGSWLRYLETHAWTSIEHLHRDVKRPLQIYMDPSEGSNAAAELDRCAQQYIPAYGLETSASKAVTRVARIVCREVFALLETRSLQTALDNVSKLNSALSWSSWKRCEGECRGNRVCFLPMWPLGSKQDYAHPTCRSVEEITAEPRDYWGPPRVRENPSRHRDAFRLGF